MFELRNGPQDYYDRLIRVLDNLLQLMERQNHSSSFIREHFVDSTEMCEILHISERTLQKMVREGVIPVTYLGKKPFFDTQAVVRVMQENAHWGLTLNQNTDEKEETNRRADH